MHGWLGKTIIAYLVVGLSACSQTGNDYDPVIEFTPQAPLALAELEKINTYQVGKATGARVCIAAVATRHRLPASEVYVTSNFDGNYVEAYFGNGRPRLCAVGSNGMVQEMDVTNSDPVTQAWTIIGDDVSITSVSETGQPTTVLVRVPEGDYCKQISPADIRNETSSDFGNPEMMDPKC